MEIQVKLTLLTIMATVAKLLSNIEDKVKFLCMNWREGRGKGEGRGERWGELNNMNCNFEADKHLMPQWMLLLLSFNCGRKSLKHAAIMFMNPYAEIPYVCIPLVLMLSLLLLLSVSGNKNNNNNNALLHNYANSKWNFVDVVATLTLMICWCLICFCCWCSSWCRCCCFC